MNWKKFNIVILVIVLIIGFYVFFQFVLPRYTMIKGSDLEDYCDQTFVETIQWENSEVQSLVVEAESGNNSAFVLRRIMFDEGTAFCSYAYYYESSQIPEFKQVAYVVTKENMIYSITFFSEFFTIGNLSTLFQKYGAPDYIGYVNEYSKYRRSLIWLDEGINLVVQLNAGSMESGKPECYFPIGRVDVRFLTYFKPGSDYMDFPLYFSDNYYVHNKLFFQRDKLARDPFSEHGFEDYWITGEEACFYEN